MKTDTNKAVSSEGGGAAVSSSCVGQCPLKWTKEDVAATLIQTNTRRFLAKRLIERKKKEKKDYAELMDKLEREVCLFIYLFNRSINQTNATVSS